MALFIAGFVHYFYGSSLCRELAQTAYQDTEALLLRYWISLLPVGHRKRDPAKFRPYAGAPIREYGGRRHCEAPR